MFATGGYTATIGDVRVLSTFTGVGIATPEAERLNSTTTLGTNTSKTAIGTTLPLEELQLIPYLEQEKPYKLLSPL